MNAEYHKAMAGHMAFIKKVHEREMAKIRRALENPAPVLCACCRRKMAEKHRKYPNERPTLKIVK